MPLPPLFCYLPAARCPSDLRTESRLALEALAGSRNTDSLQANSKLTKATTSLPHDWGARDHPGAASGDDDKRQVRDAIRNRHQEEEFLLIKNKRPGPTLQKSFQNLRVPHFLEGYRLSACLRRWSNSRRRVAESWPNSPRMTRRWTVASLSHLTMEGTFRPVSRKFG